MLEEVGAPYRIAVVNLDAREHERPEYLAVNPLGMTPAIEHRESPAHALTEIALSANPLQYRAPICFAVRCP